MTPLPDLPPEILRAQAVSLRRLATALLGDADAAEDVVQDAWLTALTRPPAREERLAAWLATVGRRLALRRLRGEARRGRRERAHARPDGSGGSGGSGDAGADDGAEERARVLRAVTDAVLGLEEPYRTAVLLRFFEDLPPRAIAARQAVPVTTVKSRLRRALARLRGVLARELGPDGWRGPLAALLGTPLAPALPSPPDLPGPAVPAAASSPPLPLVPLVLGGLAVTTITKLLAAGAAALALGLLVWSVERDARAPGPVPEVARVAPGVRPMPGLVAPGAAPGTSAPSREELAPTATAAAREQGLLAPPRALHELRLAGQVVDRDDLPVAGASIYLAPPGHPFVRVGTTDAAGAFAVRWLAAVPAADWLLAVRGSGPPRLLRVRVAAGVPAEVRVQLPEDSSRSRVAFSLAIEVSGERIVLRSPDPLATAAEALRDPEGRIVFTSLARCPSRRHEGALDALTSPLLLEAAGGRSVVLSGDALRVSTALETVLMTDHLAADGVADRRVRGRLLDAEGRPVAGAPVVAGATPGRVDARTRTDAEGAYELVLPALGTGELHLRAGGGDHGLAHGRWDVQPGRDLDWSPWLERGEEVRGRLVTPEGAPLAGWTVAAVVDGAGGPLEDAATTDERGAFAIPNLAPGPLRLLLSGPDHDLPARIEPSWPGAERDLEVPAEAAAAGSLRVRVADEQGRDLPEVEARLVHLASGRGVWLGAHREELAEEGSEEPSATIVLPTEGSGPFVISSGGRAGTTHHVAERLPAGTYELEVGARGRTWQRLGPIQLGRGERLDLGTVELAPPAQLALEMPGPGTRGRPTLLLWHELAEVPSLAYVAGEVAPPALALVPGDYVLEARAADEASRPVRSALRLEPGERAGRALEEREGGLELVELEQGGPPQPPAEPASCTGCHGWDEDR